MGQLREMAAKLGRERVGELYLWDDVTKRVEAAYRQLLGQEATASAREPAIPLDSDSLDRAA